MLYRLQLVLGELSNVKTYINPEMPEATCDVHVPGVLFYSPRFLVAAYQVSQHTHLYLALSFATKIDKD